MNAPRTVSCPACGKASPWSPDNRWRPFCSERCKLIDLGAWAAEQYRVPAAPPDDPQAADSNESRQG
ncbi:MAG: DNA gyrase inhibitor YacG [Rhodocyclaceae bacterium]